jgi:hypothetical protein
MREISSTAGDKSHIPLRAQPAGVSSGTEVRRRIKNGSVCSIKLPRNSCITVARILILGVGARNHHIIFARITVRNPVTATIADVVCAARNAAAAIPEVTGDAFTRCSESHGKKLQQQQQKTFGKKRKKTYR